MIFGCGLFLYISRRERERKKHCKKFVCHLFRIRDNVDDDYHYFVSVSLCGSLLSFVLSIHTNIDCVKKLGFRERIFIVVIVGSNDSFCSLSQGMGQKDITVLVVYEEE